MGRTTCFDVDGMKKGEWTAEEDQKLVAYINEHGSCDWRSLPRRAGLLRYGKSCRLRWLNYLRPGIKKCKFTPKEEEEIIKLHAILGNRWAAMAKQMMNRTDNDIKNHWNSCLKKRLSRKGIDPMTHEPIIKHLTVKTTNEDSGSSSTIRSPSMESSPSSSGSARLLNKVAASISSRQHNLDRIKYILSNPITISCGEGQEEDEERNSNKDQKIDDGEAENVQKWDVEEIRRLMEMDIDGSVRDDDLPLYHLQEYSYAIGDHI